MMKRSAVICLIITASTGNVGEGLVAKSTPSFAKRNSPARIRHHSSGIKMYLDGIDDSLLSSPLLSSMSSNIFRDTSQHIASDPQLEAEILTDVSHVALDLTTFVSPNTAWIRFCNVFGRLLIISSDYIQDQYISPDEAFFQAAMLAISTQMLFKSAWPVILAASSKTSLSVRERRAFTQLFNKLDLSVLQFKTLLTSNTLDWVELKPYEQVDFDGDYMYWLHTGEISSSLHEHSASTDDNSLQIGHRMFGEVHFAKVLEESKYKSKIAKSNKAKAAEDSNNAVNETLAAGPKGAVLLRMSTSKLLKLMNNDDQLFDSINGLILQCMQEKLTRTFQKQNWKNSNACQSSFSATPNATVS